MNESKVNAKLPYANNTGGLSTKVNIPIQDELISANVTPAHMADTVTSPASSHGNYPQLLRSTF